MTASGAIERGRSAAAARRWSEACDRFAEARSADPAGLSAPDLELFATASFLRGRPTTAFEALTSAHESYLASDETVGAARTAGWLALELLEVGEVSSSANWIARGLRLVERLGDSGSVSGFVALVPAAFTAMFVGDIPEAIRRFDAIGAIAERTGDLELAAHAAFGRGKALTTIGRTAEGFAGLDAAMDAVRRGEVSPITTCMFFRIVLDVWHEGFDLDRAEKWTAYFAEWCGAQPQLVAYSGQAHAYRAQLLLLHGSWAEASAAAHLAEERLRAGDFTAGFVANHQLAELHRLRGEFRAADDRYRRAAETGWDPQPGLALLRLAEGDAETAQTMIRQRVAAADDAVRRRLLPAVVEIETAARDVVAARRAADELSAFQRSAPTTLLAAVVAACEARVLLDEGQAERALGSVDAARASWSALEAPYEMASCGVLRGRILSALGDTEAAAAEFDAARAVFVDLGARSALAELNILTGERPAGTLTAREVEVLRLVSTGLTNRGIAERLSLSEKTVARHLSNIFGKLGLSTRSAATAYAYEHGLI
ncbi:regulatory protein, luxR family [Microbacterium sp. cf046]|uniref:helix-turn-helix transcriptional regulator n=1 Tax=Microbacterium sp. cf046 TaxID=1761803 RepID=UPI0008EBF493|nr:helix-turn-helix transcriptional regulator [Microbacterium sp. cf046]SFS15891.1 regulatory protein, luxR family [Microbacterium sp. cf046]